MELDIIQLVDGHSIACLIPILPRFIGHVEQAISLTAQFAAGGSASDSIRASLLSVCRYWVVIYIVLE